ncbi:MAG: response regulator [bacterium]|nr:response regulator [bacterium]
MTDENNINLNAIPAYKTILIIEDEDPIRWALKENLGKEGLNVIEAKNGQEGLELALKEHPDLILLDLVLPKVYGLDMLKKLREDEWGQKALVIVLTSLDDGEITQQAKDLGINDFLVKKDWKLEDLVRWVKNKLEI